MTLDEFVIQLQALQAQGHGQLPVVMEYDCMFEYLEPEDFPEHITVGALNGNGWFVAVGDDGYSDIQLGPDEPFVRIQS